MNKAIAHGGLIISSGPVANKLAVGYTENEFYVFEHDNFLYGIIQKVSLWDEQVLVYVDVFMSMLTSYA